MELVYWGFRRRPFERSFAADRFFAGSIHEEAMARLLFLVEEYRRSGIVMGPAGTGKTFLLRLVQQRADRMGRQTVWCDATGLDGAELAGQIALGCRAIFDTTSSLAATWNGIRARLAAMAIVHQSLVVIIDHFDLVDDNAQQAICRLHQMADSVGVRLTVILATRDRLVPADLRDTVEMRIEVGDWTVAECSQFIKSSLHDSGSESDLFTDDALLAIHELTNGAPGRVVSTCNLALLAAMASDERQITRATVEAVISEMSPRIDERRLRLRHSLNESAVTSLAE